MIIDSFFPNKQVSLLKDFYIRHQRYEKLITYIKMKGQALKISIDYCRNYLNHRKS